VAYPGIVPEAFLGSLSVGDREASWRTILEESKSETYAADEGHEITGWISVGRSRDPDAASTTGEVWAIYVAPEHWGRGVGRALWNRGESWLEVSGFLDVTLWVLKDNERALGFYESVGFALDAGQKKEIELGGARLLEIRLRRRLPVARRAP